MLVTQLIFFTYAIARNEWEKIIRLVNQIKITMDYRTLNFYPTTISTNTMTVGSHAHITSDIRYLKIAVYGKRLTTDILFAVKTKPLTVKCFTYTIY